MFTRTRPIYVVHTFNNRVEIQRVIKSEEDNIKTKRGNYEVEPSHGLPDVKRNITWYFLNKHSNKTYNPSTLKDQFDMFHKAVLNYKEFYLKLITIVRNSYLDDQENASTKYFEDLKSKIHEFDESKPIDSDNIRTTPSTQKRIMENEVAKSLSAKSRRNPFDTIMLMAFGAILGLMLGVWLGGDVYHQEKYIENDYYTDDTNSTIITAGHYISNGGIDLPTMSYAIEFNMFDNRLYA